MKIELTVRTSEEASCTEGDSEKSCRTTAENVPSATSLPQKQISTELVKTEIKEECIMGKA